MSKAEEIAKQLYPDWESTSNPKLDGQEQSNVRIQRQAFLKGYRQAEKDLALSWQDISNIMKIYEDILELDFCDDTYGEVAKRFNERKALNNE